MMPWRLSELARLADGHVVGDDCSFTSVTTDSRALKPSALFVALSGPNFDGHDFVAAAAASGAAAALVDRALPAALSQVVVPDPLAALSVFARQWRRQFHIPLIGVTGSNGKTTTKELIGSILSRIGPTLVTRGNLNNHIGVPLMLLELTVAHRFAVIEMGANHPGEIAHLANIAEPTIGMVTNAGAAHLEGFGSLQGVATAKGELFHSLPVEGVAIINADDAFAAEWRDSSAAERVLTFGFEQPADFMAHKVRERTPSQPSPASGGGEGSGSASPPPSHGGGEGSGSASPPPSHGGGTGWGPSGFLTEFELVTPYGSRPATLALAGLHNLRNALGAAAAACAAGVEIDDIVAGLAATKRIAGRLELKAAINGAFIVDDSYNANPSSLKAGLDAFRGFGGVRWLVLGEMRELGAASDELHGEVGRYAQQAGIQRLFAVGEHSRFAVEAFGPGAQWFADLDSLITEVRGSIGAGVAVLIKGSRANRLERVTAALAAAPGGSAHEH